MSKSKKYLFREYLITEYQIKAESRKEAESKLYGQDCEQRSEWLWKTTIRLEKK